MKRLLFSGYYGFDNAGDEAVLAGLIAGLRKEVGQEQLTIDVLSINPSGTTALHNVSASHRYRNFALPLAKCDLLLSGGGSLLQDVTSAHGIFYYLAIIRIAQLLGKKTMLVAQGIGPLIRPRSRKLTASVANATNAITVRDNVSKRTLESIGVRKEITVTADPALLLKPMQQPPSTGVLLSMRPWAGSEKFSSILAEAIDNSKLPVDLVPLDMYGDGDNRAALDVMSKVSSRSVSAFSQPGNRTYVELLQQVAGAELVIGMRLHALIFAAACGITSVALSYDPKIDAFMNQCSQNDVVFDIANGDAVVLTRMIDTAWEQRIERRKLLQEVLPSLKASALKNANIALSLAGSD